MAIFRVKADLSGFIGAPGLNSWFFSSGTVSAADISAASVSDATRKMLAFYNAIALNYPQEIVISMEPFATVFDEADGSVKAIVASDAITDYDVRGGGGESFTSRATQMVLNLRTSKAVRRRLLRGRIFIGPLDNGVLTSRGEISPGSGAATVGFYEDFVRDQPGPAHVVWSRPVFAPRVGDDPPAVRTPGTFGLVDAVDYKPLPGSLRSRRD